MVTSFLLALREGLEAALIIGVILSILQKINRQTLRPVVWQGVFTAAGLSAIIAVLLTLLGMGLEGTAEEVFEGVAMLLAAGVLTWMILWMHQNSSSLRHGMEAQTNMALHQKGKAGLFALAFLAVFREGVELALFLLAAQASSTPLETLGGAVLGLLAAVGLGWVLFTTTRRLSIQRFFQVTNILLILFAAGLVGLGVHELNEAGIIPAIIDPVWNINPVLSDTSQIGLILKALLGYNGNPSLTEVLAYGGYFGLISIHLLTQQKRQTSEAGI